MSRPTVDQASKQNIGDSEFGNLVVRWREQDNTYEINCHQTDSFKYTSLFNVSFLQKKNHPMLNCGMQNAF